MEKAKFRFLYEPGSEAELCLLFGCLMPYNISEEFERLGFGSGDLHVDEWTENPTDCLFRLGDRELKIEFELYSSNFQQHPHDPEKCDIIVCWKHDWYGCPKTLRVLALDAIVSKLAREKGIRVIVKDRVKHPDRGGRRWTIPELLDKLRESLPDSDYKQLKGFIDELSAMEGLQLKTGRGRKIPTLDIGVTQDLERFGQGQYPLTIEATGRGSMSYYNVNANVKDKNYPPLMEKEKIDKIKGLLGAGAARYWHYIGASSTAELIDKLRKVIDVMLGS